MIGVAGCGRMGRPMLDALREGGTAATGFDIEPKQADYITDNIMRFAPKLETLIVTVADAKQIEALLFGTQNIMRTAPKLARIILCTTISPDYAEQLRTRISPQIALIDAAAAGTGEDAALQDLIFWIGGAKKDVQDSIPLLALMGTHFHHMGGYGAGMKTMALTTLMAAANVATTRMVLDNALAMELDQRKILTAIDASPAQNWFASNFRALEYAQEGYTAQGEIEFLARATKISNHLAGSDEERRLCRAIETQLKNLSPIKLAAKTL